MAGKDDKGEKVTLNRRAKRAASAAFRKLKKLPHKEREDQIQKVALRAQFRRR